MARIPTLAVHFGEPARGPFNYETNMIPILGLASSEPNDSKDAVPTVLGKNHSSRFLHAIARSSGENVSGQFLECCFSHMIANQRMRLAEDLEDFSVETRWTRYLFRFEKRCNVIRKVDERKTLCFISRHGLEQFLEISVCVCVNIIRSRVFIRHHWARIIL